MKVNFRTIGLILVICLCPNVAWARGISLIWTEQTLDDEALLQFAHLSENDIIKNLRNQGIKVLILNKTTPNHIKNPQLTIGNLKEEDEEAVNYYTKDKDIQTAIRLLKTPLAEFLRPHFHVHDLNEIVLRPYLDKPVILVTQSITRMPLIHEYLHAVIYNLSPVKEISVGGKIHHKACAQDLEYQNRVTKMMENQKKAASLPSSTPEKEKLKIAETFYVAMLNFYLHMTNQYSESHGEEMDVHRVIYEYRNDLKLTQTESLLALNNLVNHFNQLDDLLMPLIQDPNLKILKRDLHYYSLDVQNKYAELERFKEIFSEKMFATKQWHNKARKQD